jgi:hypothetical protein
LEHSLHGLTISGTNARAGPENFIWTEALICGLLVAVSLAFAAILNSPVAFSSCTTATKTRLSIHAQLEPNSMDCGLVDGLFILEQTLDLTILRRLGETYLDENRYAAARHLRRIS